MASSRLFFLAALGTTPAGKATPASFVMSSRVGSSISLRDGLFLLSQSIASCENFFLVSGFIFLGTGIPVSLERL